MSNNDRAEIYSALRKSTAQMLGYSEPPTPVQQLKIDVAASLRLEIDRIVSQQLAGHPVDVRSLSALAESLRSLFPPAADGAHDFSGAREELARFLASRAAALKKRAEREEEAAEKGLSIVDTPGDSKPACGERDDGVAPRPASIEPAATAGGGESAPQPKRETDLERMAKANAVQPPSHYLRGPEEEWRRWVDENGIRSSPWSR